MSSGLSTTVTCFPGIKVQIITHMLTGLSKSAEDVVPTVSVFVDVVQDNDKETSTPSSGTLKKPLKKS